MSSVNISMESIRKPTSVSDIMKPLTHLEKKMIILSLNADGGQGYTDLLQHNLLIVLSTHHYRSNICFYVFRFVHTKDGKSSEKYAGDLLGRHT